jgi:hypothetical protein
LEYLNKNKRKEHLTPNQKKKEQNPKTKDKIFFMRGVKLKAHGHAKDNTSLHEQSRREKQDGHRSSQNPSSLAWLRKPQGHHPALLPLCISHDGVRGLECPLLLVSGKPPSSRRAALRSLYRAL